MLQEEVLQSSPEYHQQQEQYDEDVDELPAEDYVQDTTGMCSSRADVLYG